MVVRGASLSVSVIGLHTLSQIKDKVTRGQRAALRQAIYLLFEISRPRLSGTSGYLSFGLPLTIHSLPDSSVSLKVKFCLLRELTCYTLPLQLVPTMSEIFNVGQTRAAS